MNVFEAVKQSVTCLLYTSDRWASGFHLCLQKNECRCFCRKCNALSTPGFGHGAVHSGVVRNGADLVCMDNPQTEKAKMCIRDSRCAVLVVCTIVSEKTIKFHSSF